MGLVLQGNSRFTDAGAFVTGRPTTASTCRSGLARPWQCFAMPGTSPGRWPGPRQASPQVNLDVSQTTLRGQGARRSELAAMEIEPEDLAEYKRRFRIIRRRQWIATIVFFASLVAAYQALSERHIAGVPPSILGPIAVGAFAFSFSFGMWNWRCPACRFFLPNRGRVRSCLRCKIDLS